jgi:hypothetical protein
MLSVRVTKMFKLLLFFQLLLVPIYASADSPAMPRPIITVSAMGQFYFKMIPERFHFKDNIKIIDSLAFGQAFKLNEDGSSEKLWGVSGWYSFKTLLSDDGEYLVRMGDWPEGSEPSHNDIAVVFYKEGKEIKKYSTAELIENKENVQATVSHYFWLSYDDEYPQISAYSHVFSLKTIENKVIEFNISNGEIIEK